VKTLALLLLVTSFPALARAQTLAPRGFVEGSGVFFPQETPGDSTQRVGSVLARTELFVKAAEWIQFAAGLDLRAHSHDQVDDGWRLDWADRGLRRPRLSVRRLSATLTRGPFSLDAGKQFVRWGKTDIVTPTDRFAPRDFLNVIDNEFLGITAIRAVVQFDADTFEGVWTPRFTPSRIPLIDQRWSAAPPASGVPIAIGDDSLPSGSQAGVRWSHLGRSMEYSVSYFEGFNHLPSLRPDVQLFPPQVRVARLYPSIRSAGFDMAAPVPWFTVKGEAAYVASSSDSGAVDSDDYLLYVVQLERQTGEWLFVGGYAGEVVARSRSAIRFAPDRGLSRAVVLRVSYTFDSNRSAALEGAARQNGRGVYVKGEYSQAHGQHLRTTVAVVGIAGRDDDFLGQYRRNSNAVVAVRYSF
jgi:hypothetical protein